MKNITLIAAIGKNRELGKNNQLIWSIPEDLRFFKENTMNSSIIMGINTFYSLPKLLPGRKHIVLTHRDALLDSSVIVFHNLSELLEYIEKINEEVFVIGGAQIYNQMIGYADKMLLTEIDRDALADVYFPEILVNEWDRKVISEHKYNDIEYRHVQYIRKGSYK